MKTKCEFLTFWEAYGKKRNRIAAACVWRRLPDKDRRAAIAGIASYRNECMRTGVAMMYPQNYLKYRRWTEETDDISAPTDDPIDDMGKW